ncbi:MAG TPA: peptidase M28 family protein, partial [Gemmatimonadales bacterium]|nr:peptidase M28 family protein [Gemmatimonadales bacterium]
MRSSLLSLVLVLVPALSPAQQRGGIEQAFRPAAEGLIAAATADSAAWEKLAELTDTYGHRLSGSRSLELAIDWVVERMRRDGLENVRTEPVMVPHWVRGHEQAELLEPRWARLPMLGLGGSVGTPAGGITGEVLVVSSFEELTRRAADARGRIVLFNVPFTSYGETVRYRTTGMNQAAKVGAIGVLLR